MLLGDNLFMGQGCLHSNRPAIFVAYLVFRYGACFDKKLLPSKAVESKGSSNMSGETLQISSLLFFTSLMLRRGALAVERNRFRQFLRRVGLDFRERRMVMRHCD